jgi:hypothetical protein
VATAVVTPGDDPLFDIDDFGNFYDTVLDELDNDTGTHDPQFDVDDFGDFYNFELDELDELDGGSGTHPGTSTVAQATAQLEDDTPLAAAQPDGTQKRKRGRPKGSKDKEEAETHRGQRRSGWRLWRCCLKAQPRLTAY